jgi:hypothetical protein
MSGRLDARPATISARRAGVDDAGLATGVFRPAIFASELITRDPRLVTTAIRSGEPYRLPTAPVAITVSFTTLEYSAS